MSWREPTPQERKKTKELDEARKAGKISVELDEDGNEINPHIPSFIKDAPWYIHETHGKPSLKHQRKDQFGSGKIATIDQSYDRGKFKVCLIVRFADFSFNLSGTSCDLFSRRRVPELRRDDAPEEGLRGTTAQAGREVHWRGYQSRRGHQGDAIRL
jgi:hypothetical protein